MSGKSVITLSSARGIAKGTALAIEGEDVLLVKAVRGNAVTVVRWRRWHTTADRARNATHRWWRDVNTWAEARWCGRGDHRLDSDGYCRCGERAHPDWLEE